MTTEPTEPPLLHRALYGVAGFAVAISLVHLVQGIGLILALGMPPLTGFVIQAVVMDLLLASALGLLFAALYRAPRGEWVFPVAMAVLYVVLERIVAVDPNKIGMWVGPSVGGLVVFAIGRALWRWKPPVVVGLVTVLTAVLMVLPIGANLTRGEAAPRATATKAAPEGAPDVLMIVMDTVRAQNTSTYGYHRPTTPNLDALAAEGVVFEGAYAPSTWSLPAHASLFTGTFPSRHAAHDETRYLTDTLPTLADVMAASGWTTHAFSANPHISPSFGLTRGFQHNDKAWAAGTSGRNFSFIYRVVDALGLGQVDDKGGRVVVGNITEWMAERKPDDPPAFVFVNFLEAHFPFRQLPAEYRESYQHADMNTLREIDQIAFGVQFGRQLTPEEMTFVHQPLVDLYDGGVRYTDHLVGEVIDVWKKAGRLDNTVVVVLADHGEMVGEHGAFGHVTPVLEQDLRVPLVVRYPARVPKGRRVSDPVSTTGTMATILDLAGAPPAPTVQVHSLMRVVNGEPEVGLPLIAERFEEEMLASRFAPGTANGHGEQVNPRGRYQVYRSGDWKLVRHWEDGHTKVHLFDLANDPTEDHDVAASRPDVLAPLEREFDDERAELGLPAIDAKVEIPKIDPASLAPDERAALIELGYIEE